MIRAEWLGVHGHFVVGIDFANGHRRCARPMGRDTTLSASNRVSQWLEPLTIREG
jgi:hypothetical protein